MCDPITMTALALTAAGTAAQYQGARQAKKAMNAAAGAESQRQAKLRGEADALFQDSLSKQGSESQVQRLADIVKERQAGVDENASVAPVANIPVINGAPNIVADETAAAVNQGNVRASDEAKAKATLAAFGDLQLGNALANARAGSKQSQLANFMGGSQAVLGSELQAASRRGDKMKMIGDLLSTAGQITGMYGVGKALSAGSAAASSPNTVKAVYGSPALNSGASNWYSMYKGAPLPYGMQYPAVAPAGTQFMNPVVLPRIPK